jgi:hypothetical protein
MKQKIRLSLTYYAAETATDESSLEQIRQLHGAGVGSFEMLDWQQKAVTITAMVDCNELGQPLKTALLAAQKYMIRHAARQNARPVEVKNFTFKLISE